MTIICELYHVAMNINQTQRQDITNLSLSSHKTMKVGWFVMYTPHMIVQL